MNKETIIIDNLKCGGCANTIIKQLNAIDGVHHVNVEVEASTVRIGKETTVTRALLLEKLAAWGYPEMGTTNLVQKAKSYVSCAIGRLEN